MTTVQKFIFELAALGSFHRNEHPGVKSYDVSGRFCLKCHILCPKNVSFSWWTTNSIVTSLDELSSYLKLEELNPSNYFYSGLWKLWHWNAIAHTLKCLSGIACFFSHTTKTICETSLSPCSWASTRDYSQKTVWMHPSSFGKKIKK